MGPGRKNPQLVEFSFCFQDECARLRKHNLMEKFWAFTKTDHYEYNIYTHKLAFLL